MNGAAAAGGSITGATSALTGVKSTVNSSLGSISLGSIQNSITMGAMAALGVIAAIILFQSVLVCRNVFACCMFKTLAPVSIVLNFIIFLLAGIFYIVGVIGADLCYDPNALIAATISEPNLNYFLTCATDPAVPPAPALGLVSGVINTVAGGLSQLTTLNSQVATAVSNGQPAGYGPLISGGAANPAFSAATTDLTNAVAALQAIPGVLLSCQQVDAMFSRLWDGLCNGTITSALGIARVLIAAGVFMLLQMAVRFFYCPIQALRKPFGSNTH